MKQPEFEHIIRAAAAITKESVFVVVGSQAILAEHPAAPAEMLVSNELDIYPANKPELADLIDGAIGRDSPFHQTFHYYADGVGPETARLPSGWERRAHKLRTAGTGGATAICLEIHDIAASKMLAGRDKDLSWVQAGLRAGLIDRSLLLNRLDLTPASGAERALAANRVKPISRE